MAELSTISSTAVVAPGSELHVIQPGGGSPTGFASRRITVTNFQSGLQTQITANAGNITTLQSDVSDLQDFNSRTTNTAQTANFTVAQAARSRLVIVRVYNDATGAGSTLNISATGYGNGDILATTTTNEFQYQEFEIAASDGWSAVSRTLYFQVTGESDYSVDLQLNVI